MMISYMQYYPETDLSVVLCGTFVKNLEVCHERDGSVIQHDRVVVTGLGMTGALSTYGDCGTPLLAFASALPQKIVGMHVAGSASGTHSYSTALTVERLKALCSEVPVELEEVSLRPQRPVKKSSCLQHDQSSPAVGGGFAPVSVLNFGEYFLQPEEYSECRNFIPETTMTYVGDSCVMASNPGTSELRKTPFVVRGAFPFPEDMKMPSVLVESDSRLTDPNQLLKDGTGKPSILLTQLKKFCGPDYVMDEELLTLITEQLIEYSVSFLDGQQLASHPDLMMWEALNGVATDSHFQPLAFKSSAGVPWNAIGGTRKIDYLVPRAVKTATGMSSGYWFDNDKPAAKLLYHAAMHKLEMAIEGVRTFSIWKDCLKDELRPSEKVAVGKTRAFSSSPFETVLVGRGLFGRYKAAWTAAGGGLFHSVGIDPNSAEWQRLYSDLNIRDSRYIDGDFSNFDGSIPARLMEAAGEVVIETIHRVSPDNFRTARYVVWDEFIHTIQIAGSTVYQKHHGNNSGNPMTTPANCWVNVIAEIYCYYMLTGARSLAKWKADVVFRCFGDDCVRAVSKKCDPHYNPLELVRVYETFGMTFTTATKTTEQRWVTLEEVVYLQRKFKQLSPAVVLAPLVAASVYQCFNYCSLVEHELEGWQGLLGEQLAEAARHGKNFFAFVVGRLRNALHKLPSTAFRREMSTVLLTTFDDVYAGVLVKAGADLKIGFEKHC
nr:MAG: RNA-dependent RNA polymerase [Crogonang virus 141]